MYVVRCRYHFSINNYFIILIYCCYFGWVSINVLIILFSCLVDFITVFLCHFLWGKKSTFWWCLFDKHPSMAGVVKTCVWLVFSCVHCLFWLPLVIVTLALMWGYYVYVYLINITSAGEGGNVFQIILHVYKYYRIFTD